MSPSSKTLHGQLPENIDPILLAERGARLTGHLPLKDMTRIMQVSPEGSGDVFVDLSFERSEGERIFLMHGDLQARLRVTCQRCLEPMDLELKASPWLILQRPGAPTEPSESDADVLVVDKPVSLGGLVEDELLLALPMVPMHDPEHCPAGKAARSRMAVQHKVNPFAVLNRLKRSK